MAVYVDPMFACQPNPNWRYRSACHLFADTVDELQAFAQRLGMQRSWFQDGRFKHYDLTARMREKAVRLGAIDLTSRQETIDTWRRIDRGFTRIVRKTMKRVWIRLLRDIPIASAHGLTTGRVFEVIGEKRMEAISSAGQGRRELFYVMGDSGERCGVRPGECEIV